MVLGGGGYDQQRLESINLKLLNSVSHFLSEAAPLGQKLTGRFIAIRKNSREEQSQLIDGLFSKGTIQRLGQEGKRISYLSTYYGRAPPRSDPDALPDTPDNGTTKKSIRRNSGTNKKN